MSPNTAPTQWNAPSRRIQCLLLGVAFLLRGGAMFMGYEALEADPDGYRAIANLLLETGEYRRPLPAAGEETGEVSIVTAYRPPLYPLLLAALGLPTGTVGSLPVAVLHVLLGVATVWLTFRLAWAVLGEGYGVWWSVVAALGVACDPILLRQASLVMTETLVTFLAVAGMLALHAASLRLSSWRILLAGVVLGLACLCRPTFLPWLCLASLAMGLIAVRRHSTNGPMLLPLLRAATVTVLGAGAMLLPWMLRNYLQFGQPLIATSHGGYTLLLANNPEFYAFLKQANGPPVWDAETSEMAAAWRAMQEQARDDELAVDRWATAQAWQHIAEYPADFAYSTAVRVGRFWQWLPHRTSRSEPAARFFARLAVALWYGCVTGAALLGALVLRRDFLNSPLLWGLLLAGSLTLVHAIYWSNMRMRAPVMPLVCVLAAVGGAEVSRRK